MTEIKFFDWEHNRWATAVSLWNGRDSLTGDYHTTGTLAGYVPTDNYGSKKLISVQEGRAVDLSADSGKFRSTKAA